MNTLRDMEDLVAGILDAPQQERPELAWLKEQYTVFLEHEHAGSRRAADSCLYKKIYGKTPKSESDILKIRYWRTGQHFPSNHSTCIAFGQALGLSRENLLFLIQGYYDSCDQIFEKEPDQTQELYWKRRELMKRLTKDYLMQKIQTDCRADVVYHNIRHFYYTDALQCVRGEYIEQKYNLKKHITSINYESELTRNLKLLGTIPRRTMIRHLFILEMPNLSVRFMNEMLVNLGYLPLQEEHTLRTGEKLDLLLIRLLRRYEQESAASLKKRIQWMQEHLRALDQFFYEYGMHQQRFMFFKALEN